MDTGKNKMVGMRKKRALRGTLFAVILSASMSFSALAAMTADGPGMDPDVLIDNFDIVNFDKSADRFDIYLDEKKVFLK